MIRRYRNDKTSKNRLGGQIPANRPPIDHAGTTRAGLKRHRQRTEPCRANTNPGGPPERLTSRGDHTVDVPMQGTESVRVKVGDTRPCQLHTRADAFKCPRRRLPRTRYHQGVTRHEDELGAKRQRLPETHPGAHALRLRGPGHFADSLRATTVRRDRQRTASQRLRTTSCDDQLKPRQMHTHNHAVGSHPHRSSPRAAHNAASWAIANPG
jgi:hypothetical protein